MLIPLNRQVLAVAGDEGLPIIDVAPVQLMTDVDKLDQDGRQCRLHLHHHRYALLRHLRHKWLDEVIDFYDDWQNELNVSKY